MNPNRPVQVYRNLNGNDEKRWSIRQGGLVVAHASDVFLSNVQFRVSWAGWNRMRLSGKRNVHAYAKGTLRDHHDWRSFRGELESISYNRNQGFFQTRLENIREAPSARTAPWGAEIQR